MGKEEVSITFCFLGETFASFDTASSFAHKNARKLTHIKKFF